MFNQFIKNFNISLKELDTERIYVENIRSILNVNSKIAKIVCELAVRKGFFTKHISVECKNDSCGRVILSLNNEKEIPEELVCYICKDDHAIKSSFKKEELNIVPFYKYVEGSYKLSSYA
jgi:hypothetical protein